MLDQDVKPLGLGVLPGVTLRRRNGRTLTRGPRKVRHQAANMTDGQGIQVGVVVVGANRNDSILLEDSLDLLSSFGVRLPCPASTGVALDAGYDSNLTREGLGARGLNVIITPKGGKIPINKTARWAVGRINTRHARGFQLLLVGLERRTKVIDGWIALANPIIIIRCLIRQARDPPLGNPTPTTP